MPAKPDGKICLHCGITWTMPDVYPRELIKFCPQCAGWLGARVEASPPLGMDEIVASTQEKIDGHNLTEAVRRGNHRYYVEHVFPATRNVAKLPDGHPES